MFRGNKIYKIDRNGKRHRIFFCLGIKIKFKGKNSVIELEAPFPKYKNCTIIVDSDCKVKIGSSIWVINKLDIKARANCSTCFIGRDFSVTDRCLISFKEEGKTVKIGNDCMFGPNIKLRTSDFHSLINKETNEVINKSGDINIGNHCWLAEDVTVLKNVKIVDNCVVGVRTLVTKDCSESNCVYAGIPAKKINDNVDWSRITPDRMQILNKN